MNQRPRPKRIWLVNRDFQFRYAGAGVLAGLTSTLITATLIIYPLFVFKIVTVSVFLPWPIILSIVSAIALNCLMQIIFGILLTHKIAGPMFSLVRHLRMIASGRWNIKMRQRSGDELDIVVRHLNETSAALTTTTKEDLDNLANIIALVESAGTETSQLGLLKRSLEDMVKRLERRILAPEGAL